MGEVIIAKLGGSSNGKISISSAIITLDSGTLVYDGTLKTKSIVSVIVKERALTEGVDYTIINNAYTNAGEYVMTIMGTGNYKGTKNVNWSIEKATGSIDATPKSISIIGTNTTVTPTLTIVGDGSISAETSNNSVVAVSVNGTTVTITSVNSGSANISIILSNGNNYTGDSVTISANVVIVDSVLANNTPETIQIVAKSEIASTIWSIGDKTNTISIGAFSGISATTTIRAFIIGFNHNSTKETNGIHFQFGKIGNTNVALYSLSMNTSNTNAGGWNGSNMKSTHCSAFYSALPQIWQDVITNCTKYTDNTGGGSNTASYVTTTSDKIWLLSEFEVHGKQTYANNTEQNDQLQYDYYKNGNSKVKYKHNSTSTATRWWCRSPGNYDGQAFCGVLESGAANGFGAQAGHGFSPGFVIG